MPPGDRRLARDKANDAELRHAWENSKLTASEIGRLYGISKNTIIGLARRNGWRPRGDLLGPPVPTMLDRLAALNAAMDKLMVETGAALAKDRARYRAYVAQRMEKQQEPGDGKRIPAYGYPRAARG